MTSPAAVGEPQLRPGDDDGTDWPRQPGAFAGLLRSAAAPVLSAAVLIGLLTVWTLTGGAGTLRPVQVDVTLAAIPLSPRPGAGDDMPDATTYLQIRNLGSADELIGARSPDARGAVVVRDGRDPLASRGRLAGVGLAPGAVTNLSPFGVDLILLHPRPLHPGEIVPVTLEFSQAGRVLVDLIVTTSLASP